ncbi:methyltransferase [Streptomyces longisporoflavus]|uniref:class I SAM-dependent methyltransferase n=1 Tax=Streptomyces longisporoflavus TaxID=28044 RepID=UPI00167F15EE|nr:class I SAM-dependent methyltransferase [Streptomyces longisporoflavus]GGV36140.1 methyltransferase [Streptomyces longisporoflavus]
MTAATKPAPDSSQAAAWNGPVGTHWATHHDRYDAMLSGVNDALFEAAAISARDRVLDIGCGAGATTRIAARLAAHGHAVGVDISAPLLDRARANTASDGITNAAYERGDAQIHPFPAAGYDIAISRGGVMFFADHAAAFTNIARALRPGGRLAFVCPQPADRESEESRTLGLFAELLAKLLAQDDGLDGNPANVSPETASPQTASPEATSEAAAARTAMASLSDPARIHKVLGAFEDVRVSPVPVETVWGETPADAVDFLLSRTPDRTLDERKRATLEEVFRPYATERGVRMRAGVWLVTAVRPAA